jgi:hypothetical protein
MPLIHFENSDKRTELQVVGKDDELIALITTAMKQNPVIAELIEEAVSFYLFMGKKEKEKNKLKKKGKEKNAEVKTE